MFNLDVLALSEEVELDSKLGRISSELLAAGHTLYGKNPNYPKLLERITQQGERSLGHWLNGEFVEQTCLLTKTKCTYF